MNRFSLMNLPRAISSLFILVFLGLSSYGQTKEQIIRNIRQQFQSINSDKTLKKVSLENEEFLENMTDGGGELTGYFKKDSLVKIVEWIGLSYGSRTREYYFRDENLIFVFEKFESFIETRDGLDHSNTKITFEGRYYFDKKK
jgi:uncharacterized protein YuzB (UPF0349 family)